jgi:hypothetical protein
LRRNDVRLHRGPHRRTNVDHWLGLRPVPTLSSTMGHGYLVANCTPEARSRFPQVSPHPHAQALLTAFRHHLRR